MEKPNFSFNPFSPYAIPLLLAIGLVVYALVDPAYYRNVILYGGAEKYLTATSFVVFALAIGCMSLGIYVGDRGFGLRYRLTELSTTDIDTIRWFSILLSCVSAAILLNVQFSDVRFVENLLAANINQFKEAFNEGATFVEKIGLTLRHLIFTWAAAALCPRSRVPRLELVIMMGTAIVIGTLIQSRLLVVTLVVVLLVNYYRNRKIALGAMTLFVSACLAFLALGTFVRSFALEGKLDSETLQFIFLEIARYYLTPFGYSLAIIDLTEPNLEHGVQTVFGFFLLSIGKFFGAFDEQLNFAYADDIAPYYYESLNQIGSVGALHYGFGPIGLFFWYFAIGLVLGKSFHHYRTRRDINILAYPIMFAVALDMVRFSSLFSGPVPTCLVFVVGVVMARRLLAGVKPLKQVVVTEREHPRPSGRS